MNPSVPRGAGPGPGEIAARGLTRSFPTGRPGSGRVRGSSRRRYAVEALDLDVARGETVAVVGENGAGKTTTLRLLAGLIAPDAGAARLAGRPAVEAAARRRLGYVGEEDAFPPGLDVRGVLRLHAALAGLAGRAAVEAVEAAASALGLGAWLRRRPDRCSRGTRRRVTLAQALLGTPAALILDEPFTGLDPLARERAVAAVRRAAAGGAAVLLSLHDAAAVDALAERIVVLSGGRLVRSGPTSDFRYLREPDAGSGPPAGQNERTPAGGAPPDDWLARLLAAACTEPGAEATAAAAPGSGEASR